PCRANAEASRTSRSAGSLPERRSVSNCLWPDTPTRRQVVIRSGVRRRYTTFGITAPPDCLLISQCVTYESDLQSISSVLSVLQIDLTSVRPNCDHRIIVLA